MSYQIKSFDELVQDMVSYIVAHVSEITDLNAGSLIRSFCEGTALSLEEFYVSTYLGFRRYLDQIQENVFDFERKSGVKATTNVVFSRTGTSGAVTIPSGTEVQTSSGLSFFTTTDGVIDDGDTDSDPIEVEAEETGTSYNVLADTLTILADDIDGVESVSNANAATGGVNRETDYAYKQRFQTYIEGLGKANVAGLLEGALSLKGITSASAVELFPPVANVNVQLYVDDGSASGVSSEKIAEVQGVIDGDGTKANPGYRAGGVNVEVLAPGVVTQNVEMTVTVSTGVDVDQLKTDINLALTTYVNNLGVGSDIIYNELVTAVMNTFGVVDVDITTPSANVTISASQVGRLGTVTIITA